MKLPWKDKDKRRGLLATLLFHGLMLLVFFFFGLTYLDPKPEDGVMINFGNSAAGLGQNPTPATTPPPSTPPDPEEPVQETQDPVATQDVVEAPALKTEEKKQTKEKTEPQKETPSKKPEPDKPAPKEQEKPQPKPSKNLQDLLQKTQSSEVGGQGNTQGNQNMGDPTGQDEAGNRGGSGGGGGGSGNYRLGGRQALAKPKPNYPCADAGRVVVKIQVNRAGQVIKATPGERIPGGVGSTTASSCLYDQARQAARKTTWQPKPDAPKIQIGYIIYNFTKR